MLFFNFYYLGLEIVYTPVLKLRSQLFLLLCHILYHRHNLLSLLLSAQQLCVHYYHSNISYNFSTNLTSYPRHHEGVKNQSPSPSITTFTITTTKPRYHLCL